MNDHFLRFIRLLNEEAVEYVVIGGFAVGRHGYARYTKDMDFLIGVSPENAEKMLTVMLRFGFGPHDFELNDFLQKPFFISFGQEPFIIEILTEVPGVDFETCYANRLVDDVNGLPVNFIGLRELIQNKKAVGREQDLRDVANLPSPDDE